MSREQPEGGQNSPYKIGVPSAMRFQKGEGGKFWQDGAVKVRVIEAVAADLTLESKLNFYRLRKVAAESSQGGEGKECEYPVLRPRSRTGKLGNRVCGEDSRRVVPSVISALLWPFTPAPSCPNSPLSLNIPERLTSLRAREEVIIAEKLRAVNDASFPPPLPPCRPYLVAEPDNAAGGEGEEKEREKRKTINIKCKKEREGAPR